jgi:hypothetical protein
VPNEDAKITFFSSGVIGRSTTAAGADAIAGVSL